MTKKKRQQKQALSVLDDTFVDKSIDDVFGDPSLVDDLFGFDLPADPRAMERSIAQMSRLLDKNPELAKQHQSFGPLGDSVLFGASEMMNLGDAPPPSTPLQKAQEIIYDAFESDDPRKRVRLAKRALKISPDCADAYVIFAESQSADVYDAMEQYEKGVEAGKRALGEAFFTEQAGNFWSILETRGYMRALEGLAGCHWALGNRREATDIYRDMLRLNPVDNQGVRYTLASMLLEASADDELEALLKQYEEDASAEWTYTRALFRFRGEGNSRRAKKALGEATKHNPYVPLYLLGRKSFLASDPPQLIAPGDISEALSYFAGAYTEWLKTRGAIDWVRDNVNEKSLARLEEELD